MNQIEGSYSATILNVVNPIFDFGRNQKVGSHLVHKDKVTWQLLYSVVL